MLPKFPDGQTASDRAPRLRGRDPEDGLDSCLSCLRSAVEFRIQHIIHNTCSQGLTLPHPELSETSTVKEDADTNTFDDVKTSVKILSAVRESSVF